ncbi:MULTISPECIES: DUF6730 family protein [unclassified Leeuwenhoekiella]|uniref:DUF6730 family protein n=1 Tax=unclassified Leeuwenhoekiella TaxID=2615029 RepID=UPI000C6B1EAA|nr:MULTISPECIES: DUF6730 family protein [unclassified Leeuwenhoekiella]MAW96449.1 hypothetical protein [Leeuwenhoekiella sp.]MBA81336.1 hypothetical protein [Leeuwenhoekiella sp.]|tara:strand:- start:19432 stop:19746 length:315 start_codon:yes stop_codon:yes gene_type:complete
MTKLELLSELLVEELHSFKQEVTRLEQIEKNLKKTTITADSTHIEKLIEEHLRKLNAHQTAELENRNKILKLIRHSRNIPNWLTILAFLLFLSQAFAIIYLLLC